MTATIVPSLPSPAGAPGVEVAPDHKRRTLRRRLVGVSVLVTAAALALSGLVFSGLARRSATVTMKNQLTRQVEGVTSFLEGLPQELQDLGVRLPQGQGQGQGPGQAQSAQQGAAPAQPGATPQSRPAVLTSPSTRPKGGGGGGGVGWLFGPKNPNKQPKNPQKQQQKQQPPAQDPLTPPAGAQEAPATTAPATTAPAGSDQAKRGALQRLMAVIVKLLNQADSASIFQISDDGTIGRVQIIKGTPGNTEPFPMQRLDADKLLQGKVDTGQFVGEAGRSIYAAKVAQLPNRKFVVVLTAPLDGAGLPALDTFVFAGVVALAFAFAVAVFFARRLTRPLQHLTEATAKVATGDYSAQVKVESNDEIGDLARTFNAMADELDRSRQAEKSFVMAISHDLRTPLTSIKGYAEAIADGAARGDMALRSAQVIGNEAGRLERLVADLLDLARLDAHEFRLHPELVDLDVELRDLADAFAQQLFEAGLEFNVSARPLPMTVTDPSRVTQIVANLFQNVLRYVPAGRQVTLAWQASADGRVIAIDVADTGDGIPPDDLAHVFDRLYRAKHHEKQRSVGTGLGLAIVSGLAGALGGDVQVVSEVGRGTTFRVTLPVVTEAQMAARAEAQRQAAAPASAPSSGGGASPQARPAQGQQPTQPMPPMPQAAPSRSAQTG